MKKEPRGETVKQFIKTANGFLVHDALKLFTEDAVIDDSSVGKTYRNTEGVRDYLETYFVGYRTHTKLLKLKTDKIKKATAYVDFTGDFGHETGVLDMSFNKEGKITFVHAYLD